MSQGPLFRKDEDTEGPPGSAHSDTGHSQPLEEGWALSVGLAAVPAWGGALSPSAGAGGPRTSPCPLHVWEEPTHVLLWASVGAATAPSVHADQWWISLLTESFIRPHVFTNILKGRGTEGDRG